MVDWKATVHEERIGLLQLAEVYAYVAPEMARPVLSTYDAVAAPMGSLDVLRDRDRDVRLVAWDTYVAGLVLRGSGDSSAAAAFLRQAADLFSSCANWSAETVGQHIKRIHQAFDTHSIGQLFHECNRRGIGVPEWDSENMARPPLGWTQRG